jgi:hypothetical protein
MKLTCENCGNEFEKRPHRGRPPKICYDCKDGAGKHKEQAKEVKEKAQETGLTPVPTYAAYTTTEKLKVGHTVYILPTLVTREISKRLYARAYKVSKIAGDNIEVVRKDTKATYKQYPITIPVSRALYQSGIEYLDIKGFIENQLEGEED